VHREHRGACRAQICTISDTSSCCSERPRHRPVGNVPRLVLAVVIAHPLLVTIARQQRPQFVDRTLHTGYRNTHLLSSPIAVDGSRPRLRIHGAIDGLLSQNPARSGDKARAETARALRFFHGERFYIIFCSRIRVFSTRTSPDLTSQNHWTRHGKEYKATFRV